MNTQAYFVRLYQYNHWANLQYLSFLPDIEVLNPRIQLLFSHVLVAQKLWLTRMKERPDLSLHIWQTLPWEELKKLAEQNTKDWIEYLQTSDDQEFERVLSYQNFLKNDYLTPIYDIIIQTANHASYHRGQCAVLLRAQGIEPPNTDFITYSRIMSNQKV